MKASSSRVDFVARARRAPRAAVHVRDWCAGEYRDESDQVIGEEAVALVYNDRSHVVMMATPEHLEEFALGFSLSEGILQHPEELLDLTLIPGARGTVISMRISEARFALLGGAGRNLTGRTGCGLCGAESLEQAIREPVPVPSGGCYPHRAIQVAITGLESRQPLQTATGAAHGAAWCAPTGEIALIHEDVGRHNALDKLHGALHLANPRPDQSGFAVITSRASYEMVTKAAAMRAQLLVAVSAPTQLAVDLAQHANITLVGFARPGRHRVYTHPGRLTDG